MEVTRRMKRGPKGGTFPGRSWPLALWCVIQITTALCGSSWASEEAALAKVLQPLIEQHAGEVAVAVKHLKLGTSFYHQADRPMPTASLIKFPLMVSAYRKIEDGTLRLDKMLSLREEDKVPGSGILTAHFSPGTQISLRDAIHLMIVYSDNTATNLVADQVGLASVAADMEELGFPETKLHSKVYRRDTSIFPERSQRYGLGSTTAREMVGLFELLHQERLISPQASRDMRGHLLACEDRSKIARFLPAQVKFAHKTGEVNASKTDAGLIESPSGPIALCVLTDKNEDQVWGDDNAANRLCANLGLAVYNFFNPDPASPLPTGILAMGATGELVEALQRTLNARLQPSPGLSTDGDFGPMTQAAVIRFQTEAGLQPTGEVGPETWKALGTLITEDDPVLAPEEVNQQPWDRKEADSLEGSPFVTAKAWAVFDGHDGSYLEGYNPDEKRQVASTTKIMTAFVVLDWARRHPEVLQEKVTFSRRADETEGSTAGVRAGESLTVDELLYGLLLPSGNDAAVALAEHFGERVGDPAADGELRSRYERFVQAMNRQAQALGLSNTTYRNPHGLPDPEHLSTARDLGRLAWRAMQDPHFRRYVGTPVRGCRVEGPGGYQRNLVWKNTNQLLGIEGYHGIKTGTTEAAGACLVGVGSHQQQSRLIVVLGCAASESRYADIRNLFRWSWSQDAPSKVQRNAGLSNLRD